MNTAAQTVFVGWLCGSFFILLWIATSLDRISRK
jgi:hypothetical protein